MRRGFVYWSGIALLGLLFFSILVLWVSGKWAASAFQTGVFCLALVWAVRMIFRPYALSGSILLVPLAGIILWGFVQIFTNQTVDRRETWGAILNWMTNLLVFLLSLQIASLRGLRGIFRRALVYFGFGISVISMLQFFNGEGKVFWIFTTVPSYLDVMGPFVSRDHYSAFIELLLPLALFQALADRRRAALFAVIAATMFASVIAGASRAGAILVTLEIATVLGLAWSRGIISEQKLGARLALFGVFTVVFGSVAGWTVLWKRFQEPDPLAYRREMLISALTMARERPGMGFGLGNFRTAYPAYALFDNGSTVDHAHNDWAEWAVVGGVPFLLIVASVLFWSVRPALQSLWGLGVLSLCLHSIVDFPMQKPALAAWMFMLIGLLQAFKKSE